jgi:hypothetical protein
MRRAVSAAVVAGLLINAPTTFWSYHQFIEDAYERGVTDDELIWDWRQAQIRHAWPAAVASAARAGESDVRQVIAAAGRDDRGSRSAEVFRIVPVWWWLSPVVGIPRWLSGGFAAVLAVAGLALLRVAWRYPHRRPVPIHPVPEAAIP